MASNKLTLALLLFLTIFTYVNSKRGHLKETKISVYYQDYSGDRNTTVIEIPGPSTGPLNFSKFGAMFVTDDPITGEPEEGSAVIARARALCVTSALDGSYTHVLLSVVFIAGDYRGSTVEIQGSDAQFEQVREVAVVGGTGKFRLARGYATFETLSYDPGKVEASQRDRNDSLLQRLSSGPNLTTIAIPGLSTGPLNFTKFGAMFVMEDVITKEVGEGSAPIGRGRGIIVTSALDGADFLMLMSRIM